MYGFISRKTGVAVAVVVNVGSIMSATKLALMAIALTSGLGPLSAEQRQEMSSKTHFEMIIESYSDVQEPKVPIAVRGVVMVGEGILNLMNIFANSYMILNGEKKCSTKMLNTYVIFEILFMCLSTVLTSINGLLGLITIDVFLYEEMTHLVYLVFFFLICFVYTRLQGTSLKSGKVQNKLDQKKGKVPHFGDDDVKKGKQTN